MRLLLARHGQTRANVANVLDTVPPGSPLTDEGHRQAWQLAVALAGEPITAVYASHALRARQTAGAVAEQLGLAVTLLDGVHEAYVGDLEGSDAEEHRELFRDVYRAWQNGDLDRCAPGGETGKHVLSRYLADVDTLAAAHRDDTVLLVSHGGSLRLAAAALAPNVEGGFADTHYLPNAGTVLLERNGARWRCLRWHDVNLP